MKRGLYFSIIILFLIVNSLIVFGNGWDTGGESEVVVDNGQQETISVEDIEEMNTASFGELGETQQKQVINTIINDPSLLYEKTDLVREYESSSNCPACYTDPELSASFKTFYTASRNLKSPNTDKAAAFLSTLGKGTVNSEFLDLGNNFLEYDGDTTIIVKLPNEEVAKTFDLSALGEGYELKDFQEGFVEDKDEEKEELLQELGSPDVIPEVAPGTESYSDLSEFALNLASIGLGAGNQVVPFFRSGIIDTLLDSDYESESSWLIEDDIGSSFRIMDNIGLINQEPDGSTTFTSPAITPSTPTTIMTVANPAEPFEEGDITIDMNENSAGVQVTTGTEAEIDVGDRTFTTTSEEEIEEQNTLGEQYLGALSQFAYDTDNIGIASSWLESIPNTGEIQQQLATVTPQANTEFNNEDLQTLGRLFISRLNTEYSESNSSYTYHKNIAADALNDSSPLDSPPTQHSGFPNPALEALGLSYLDVLNNDALEGISKHINHAISEVSDPALLSALNAMKALLSYDTGFRTYTGFVISSVDEAYRSYGYITSTTPKRIIINHGGELIETPDFILAEHATMFWNLKSINGTSILAHNIVKGSFLANLDPVKDEILTVELRPGPAPNHRAIVHNDDAEAYMRSDSGESIILSYTIDGDILSILALSSDNSTFSIKEIYFGPLLQDNTRENYVRGDSWEMHFINSSALASGVQYPGIGIFNSIKGTYVANVTLHSKDAIYKYLPQEYAVKVSQYGSIEPKLVCFKNCDNLKGENSVYVREDNIGLLSLGKLSSTVTEYQGNSREVFDPNYVMMIKEDNDEYLSNFNTIYSNAIDNNEEDDLLFRLNRESRWDLSVRESLQRHNQLYYQNAKPASFTDLQDKVSFIDTTEGSTGYLNLNFFTYIINGQRKLVLNRHSYNNVVEFNFLQDKQVSIPVSTTVIVDNDIFYALENDLSIQPEVYQHKIFFRPPSQVKSEYGEITS